MDSYRNTLLFQLSRSPLKKVLVLMTFFVVLSHLNTSKLEIMAVEVK